MSKESTRALIENLRAKTASASITPTNLGDVLLAMIDEISTSGGNSSLYCFGHLASATVPGARETELRMGDVDINEVNAYLDINFDVAGKAIITAKEDCLVQITGQVNLQPTTSVTTDRVLRWFKLDYDGERYADSIMTTHFTGATQIFNIPIDYSCYMTAGETLHLTAFASGSNDSIISANSRINIQVTPRAGGHQQ